MNKLALSLLLISSVMYAPIQVNTVLVQDGNEEVQEQTWYVGDHIIRTCGGIAFDGTIREIYGDLVTVHFKTIQNNAVISENNVKVQWGQEGGFDCKEANATLKITLTDLYDKHPSKQEAEAA